MSEPTSARVFTAAFVAALRSLGLRHVCVSPGARNAPLSLAFAASDLTTWVHHDERSAAFFALGLARRLREPVAITCTSGSAATHFHPAIVEAKASRVPLLVFTADRPPELRGIGAPQTIDQLELYGTAVKWFHDAGVPDSTAPTTAPNLAAHAWTIAGDLPAGPIHINFPFREPLSSPLDAGVDVETPSPPLTMRGPVQPPDAVVTDLAERLSGRRILLVAGAQLDPAFPAALAELARTCRLPIHADPLSGLRHGGHDRSAVVVSSDLLAASGWLATNPPGAILRFGGLPTSKPLWRWMESHPEIPQVVVDPSGWRDPLGTADTMVRCDPAATAFALAKALEPAREGWLESWTAAEGTVQRLIDERLAAERPLSEPGVARLVTKIATGVVGVASSMPIRDVDAYGISTGSAAHYVGNRGTNGIDGLLSMTLGAVAASSAPGHALVGDVSALHDLSALLTAVRLDLPLTTVVIHNDGGGIFHFLPLADHTPSAAFESALATPHGTDFVAVARAMGMAADRVEDTAGLRDLLESRSAGPRLAEVRTDREANARLHREIVAEVAATIRSQPGAPTAAGT